MPTMVLVAVLSLAVGAATNRMVVAEGPDWVPIDYRRDVVAGSASLAAAGRLLVAHLTDAASEGAVFSGEWLNTQEKPGGSRVLARTGRVETTWKVSLVSTRSERGKLGVESRRTCLKNDSRAPVSMETEKWQDVIDSDTGIYT